MTESDLMNRIIAAEKRLRNVRYNPAPTVPQYGLSFTPIGPPPPPPTPNVIIVAAGADHLNATSRVITSVDAVNWVYPTDPGIDGNFGYGVAWNGTRWVASCDGNFLTSLDGVTWVARATPFSSGYDVVWCDSLNLFVAVGVSPGFTTPIVITSHDGITWTGRSTPWDNPDGQGISNVNGVDWSPDLGQILISGASSTGIGPSILTSTDGVNWTERSSPYIDGGAGMSAAAWSSDLGLWVAVGVGADGGSIYTSPDGVTWSSPAPSGGYGKDVVWSHDKHLFAVVTTSNVVKVSSDGVTWVNHLLFGGGSGPDGWGITYSDTLGLFIATTSNQVIQTSPDAVTWTQIVPPIGFNGSHILAVVGGSTGTEGGPPPATHPTRVISGASGSHNDDNTSVTLTNPGNTSYDNLGNGIFYQWTAPSNGLVTVRTDSVGSASPPDIGDTVLYVLPNNTTVTPNTDSLAFNDDDHGPTGYSGSAYYSLTTFTAVAGTTYYFFVKGYSTSETGTFSVSWTY